MTNYFFPNSKVLKGGNDSPVMCVTKSAVPDFLEGIYSFGLQEVRACQGNGRYSKLSTLQSDQAVE